MTRPTTRPDRKRSESKSVTFTPADVRRLEILAEREDRSVAHLLHRWALTALDAAGITDDGVRPVRATQETDHA